MSNYVPVKVSVWVITRFGQKMCSTEFKTNHNHNVFCVMWHVFTHPPQPWLQCGLGNNSKNLLTHIHDVIPLKKLPHFRVPAFLLVCARCFTDVFSITIFYFSHIHEQQKPEIIFQCKIMEEYIRCDSIMQSAWCKQNTSYFGTAEE